MLKLIKDIFCKLLGCSDCKDAATCEYLKFGLECFIFGLLLIFVDFIIFKFFDTSYLKIQYKNLWRTLFVFIFWSFGSMFVGYISAAFGLSNTSTLSSAIIIGISWPIIFARWAAGKLKDDVQPENAT